MDKVNKVSETIIGFSVVVARGGIIRGRSDILQDIATLRLGSTESDRVVKPPSARERWVALWRMGHFGRVL